jgi:hypothetical protein
MLKNPAKILLAILLSTGIATLLSGCLVEKKDPDEVVTIDRGTNLWHVYEADDYIEYDLTAEDATSLTQGLLRVQWEQVANIADPFDSNTTYPVLKETTTLTYEGNTSSEPDVTVIRYISQDTNGVIKLHAIGDGTGTPSDPTLYWPYADPADPPTTPVIAPVLFDSPITFGDASNSNQAFSIMECDVGLCDTEIYRYRDDSISVVGDSNAVDTPLGKFGNPFQINYSGGTTTQNSQTVEFPGDIRDACGTSSDTILSSGRFYVFPEIGIIKMVNSCQIIGSGGDTIIYTATIRETSINY